MLYLVRHSQPLSEQAAANSKLPSDAENVLTALGFEQADRLAVAFSKIKPARVICSPLARAQLTARPIAATLAVEPEIDDRLAERDYSAASGLTVQSWRDIQARNYADTSASLVGEETLSSQRERVQSWLRDFETSIRASPDENIIVVCRGGTIEHLLGCIMGNPVENMVQYFFACECASICTIAPLLASNDQLVYRIDAINSLTL